MPWEDQLPGGLADDKSPADFDPEAVLKGIKVELEHTDDRRIATEITLDHLSEDPAYYDKLAQIEPEHGDESDSDVVVPEVKLAQPRNRVFIEGDEFYAEVGSVADALFERGAERLGSEALRWLSEATAARKPQNPYRARR
jgi:hypothetical protein